MEPLITNDAIVLGILLIVLAVIFYTSGLKTKGWQRFYTYVPALLLCYFVPALLHWPFDLIAPHWYKSKELLEFAQTHGLNIPVHGSFEEITRYLNDAHIDKETYKAFQGHSALYFMASRYLLPASLILLTLSIDLKGVIGLGPKALIMFFAATVGVIIGGPIAILVVSNLFPGIIPNITPDNLWRGMSTVAGSWIGGGANQTAMKEIFKVGDNLFATMIIVDVIVANIWMGFLLYGANISDRIDQKLKADNSAIADLKHRIENYSAKIAKIPTTTEVFIMLAVAFGGVAIAHFGADLIAPFMQQHKLFLAKYGLNSLTSGFFWLIVIVTTIGLISSFTKAKKLEGIGASRWGSIFIYILVATIGMKINISEIFSNLGLFAIGIIWMLVHVTVLLMVAKLIKAPFFFVAVGSQANIGGAASAPIVASAFSPSLAPVGALMAVLGYAMGTFGALLCAYLMQMAS
ncbi:MAG TPA: DUF819 family protein [Saprospiraceae bacterium]|nr:DUF819 family protein [Saprospiraceae bacterium]